MTALLPGTPRAGAARATGRGGIVLAVAAGCLGVLSACTSASREENRSEAAASAPVDTRLAHVQRESGEDYAIGFDLTSDGGPKGLGGRDGLDQQLADAVAQVPYAGGQLFVHVLLANTPALKADLSRCGIKAAGRAGADPAADAALALIRERACPTASLALATLRRQSEREVAPPPSQPEPCPSKLALECMRRFFTDNSAEAERLGVLEARPMKGHLLLVGHGFDRDVNLHIVCAVDRNGFGAAARRAKVLRDCVESFNVKFNG